MEVRDFLTAFLALVDYEAIAALGYAFALDGLFRRTEHGRDYREFLAAKFSDSLDMDRGDDEEVNGSARRDVPDDERIVVAIDEVAGYLA